MQRRKKTENEIMEGLFNKMCDDSTLYQFDDLEKNKEYRETFDKLYEMLEELGEKGEQITALIATKDGFEQSAALKRGIKLSMYILSTK